MKRWYESKTIWLGLGTIATAVISAVAGGGWQEAVLAAIGAANIFIRILAPQKTTCTRWVAGVAA